MTQTLPYQTIKDAYIAVELHAPRLQRLTTELMALLAEQGVPCEVASADIHVSLAYTQGEVGVETIENLISQIACRGFEALGVEFEVLSGVTTPYDYLVLSIDGAAVHSAVSTIREKLITRSFDGGFKSHVSLLRFAKGAVSMERVGRLTRELNASQGAAQALGWRLALEGERICAFNFQRERCLQARMVS